MTAPPPRDPGSPATSGPAAAPLLLTPGRVESPDGTVEEHWIESRPGALEVRARIERGGAVETVRLVCDEQSLVPRGLYVAVQREGGWRTLEAIPEAGGGWLALVVSAPDGARDLRHLVLPRDVFVDYPSAAVEAVARRRLALAADAALPGSCPGGGDGWEATVLRVETPSLAATTALRRYGRQVEVP
jgi:hypothetical protein